MSGEILIYPKKTTGLKLKLSYDSSFLCVILVGFTSSIICAIPCSVAKSKYLIMVE